MKRRNFIKNSVIGLGAATGLYTWQIEPFWLEFVHVKMPIKNLPDELVGKTMMQISDVHVGKRFNPKYIIESFEEAKAFKPDFVVYTGDYLTMHKNKPMYPEIKEVFSHAVTGKLATVGILGNHDYGIHWAEKEVGDRITEILETNGITVLKNESRNFAGLEIIGFEDFWSPFFDAPKAMKNYDPSKATIILCHNPEPCDLDIWNDYQGWILAGHTHGGQCKPPFLPPPVVPVGNKRYTAGVIPLENSRTLYINRALGHLWQVRFNVRPEITIFTLERA